MPFQLDDFAPLLQVFDMPVSVAFYRDILGFELVGHSEPLSDNPDDFDWGMLRRGEMVLMLNTAYEREERPDSPNPLHVQIHRDTGLFFDCPDPDEAYKHFRAHGVKSEPPKIAPYGMKQLYVTDPDGYVLCFQCEAG